MPKCFECEEPGEEKGVTRWDVEGRMIPVATCERHIFCGICWRFLEISPISLNLECFTHGRQGVVQALGGRKP